MATRVARGVAMVLVAGLIGACTREKYVIYDGREGKTGRGPNQPPVPRLPDAAFQEYWRPVQECAAEAKAAQ